MTKVGVVARFRSVAGSKIGRKTRGIPNLAKNERDMGHPQSCSRERVLEPELCCQK
jgi:hypothetical protein